MWANLDISGSRRKGIGWSVVSTGDVNILHEDGQEMDHEASIVWEMVFANDVQQAISNLHELTVTELKPYADQFWCCNTGIVLPFSVLPFSATWPPEQ